MNSLPDIQGLVDRTRSQVADKPMFSQLGKDIPAGIVVFLVALPLCLGIALASGAPLISGLISGFIGGLVIGYISQSGTSVSGPAASVSAVVLVAIEDLGSFEIFLTALVIAGIIQFFIGLLKAGIIADYMPSSVIKGLLAAIGIILILSQLPYAVGLDFDKDRMLNFQEDYIGNIGPMIRLFFDGFSPGAILLSTVSMFILLYWDKTPLRNFRLLPPALVVVILGVALNTLFQYALPSLYLDGIQRVRIPKVDSFSSLFTFPDFSGISNPQVWLAGLTIAIIASISSLLNVEATDNIDPHKRRTPPNRELIAQGIGNTLAGLLGGIAITSVIVRSSVNIEAGGETKLSTILHGLLLLISVLFLSSVMNLIPLASLAAILLVVGYKLASISVVKQLYQKGWDQFLPFIVTVVAIILTDVLIGVLIGASLSIFFLLRGNYYNPFFIKNTELVEGETIKLELSNEVSFLNKASIKNTLWSIPDNSKVVIDATFSSYIDKDVIEILHDFQNTIAKEHNIEVSVIGLKETYAQGEELAFQKQSTEEVRQKSTPQEILAYLKSGNDRYQSGNMISKRLRNKDMSSFLSASPLAAVIDCVDLREPLNMILNTDIGDLIPIRSAATLAGEHITRSVEVACREQGAKLVLVMANSENELIKKALAAHIAGEESDLQPFIQDAVASSDFPPEKLKQQPLDVLVNEIAKFNAALTTKAMLQTSPFLHAAATAGSVGMAWAYFDRATGKVDFSELVVLGA